MADTTQITLRLKNETVEFVQGLAENQILGKDRTDVFRNLIERAIDDLIRTNFVENTIQTRKLLKNTTK